MRDEAGLEAFFSALVDAYPSSMAAIAAGLSIAQMKMTPRILIRREQYGDVGATADLDRLEAMLKEHHERGGVFPTPDEPGDDF